MWKAVEAFHELGQPWLSFALVLLGTFMLVTLAARFIG
jgi:hypothetical protein